MANPQVGPVSTYEKALQKFRAELDADNDDEFQCTTLKDLQLYVHNLQTEQSKGRKPRNLARLRGFLEAMEQYGKVIEVFLNTTDILAFVWGPVKFLLQVASTHIEAFDQLLDIYNDIGESLSMFLQYEELFRDAKFTYMTNVLELIYLDILKFHECAFEFFKKKFWKQLFQAVWKTYRSRFQPIIDNLRRHKSLLETQAGLYQFEEIKRIGVMAEAEFQRLWEAEKLNRRSVVRDWLSPVNVEEDQEAKSSARSEYPGACSWVLGNQNYRDWFNLQAHGDHVLWIHGIPGAGKSTLASFIIETLRQQPGENTLYFYCKHEDGDRDSFAAVARALISQVLQYNDDIVDYVYEQGLACGESQLRTVKKSEKILELAIKSLDKSCIIIDGLDECPSKEKSRIATWFRNLVRSAELGGSCRCLFLSQSDGDTSKLFSGVPTIQIRASDLSADIRTFCGVEGEKIKEKFGLSNAELDDILEKVSRETQDMFLYSKLVMKNLLCQTRLVNLKKELEPGRFPKDFKQAYGRIVERLLDSESPQQEDVKTLLGIMVCAKRPLKWHEIQGMISFDAEKKSYDLHERCLRASLKELCGSLADLRPNGSVELVHVTARHFLLETEHISLPAEEVSLARTCLEYLSMEFFGSQLSGENIRRYIFEGSYAFSEYAIVHWPDHLLAAISLRKEELETIAALATSVETFLNFHFSFKRHLEQIPLHIMEVLDPLRKYAFFDELVYAIVTQMQRRKLEDDLGKGQNTPQKLVNNLAIDEALSRIRRCIRVLADEPASRDLMVTFYGPNLFKCPQIECMSFHEGFVSRLDQRKHQESHDRQLSCPVTDCIGAAKNFASYSHLQTHVERYHNPKKEAEFRAYHDSNYDVNDLRDAIWTNDFPFLESFLKGDFSSREHYGKVLWTEAVLNPDDALLDYITSKTDFKDSNTQCFIVKLATKNGDVATVKRFLDDRFIKDRIPVGLLSYWNQCINIAIDCGELDILRELFDKIIPAIDVSDSFSIQNLRKWCVRATRLGFLHIVRYFVSELKVDPFQRGPNNRDKFPKLYLYGTDTIRDSCRYSVFLNAVAWGQRDIIRYLKSLEDGQIESNLEPLRSLIIAAALNGDQSTVDILKAGANTNAVDIDEDLLSLCTFRKELVIAANSNLDDKQRRKLDKKFSKALKNLPSKMAVIWNGPDRSGWTPLMVSALKDFTKTVKTILEFDVIFDNRASRSDIHALSKYAGKTALDLAKMSGHDGIHSLIAEKIKAKEEKINKGRDALHGLMYKSRFSHIHLKKRKRNQSNVSDSSHDEHSIVELSDSEF